MKAIRRLPQVFEHMNEIEDENHLHTKVFDIGPDMLELILMPIDQHHPGAPVFGITPMPIYDPEQKITRPRQLYRGSGERAYVEIGDR